MVLGRPLGGTAVTTAGTAGTEVAVLVEEGGVGGGSEHSGSGRPLSEERQEGSVRFGMRTASLERGEEEAADGWRVGRQEVESEAGWSFHGGDERWKEKGKGAVCSH